MTTILKLENLNYGYEDGGFRRQILKDLSYEFEQGQFYTILGPSGSGKTTLMNMIAGIYFPDEGEIYVGDKAATIRSPRDALDLGIGMIHQHFKLVDVFSATENIALSMGSGEKFDLKKVHDKARAICEKYEFALDLDQKVYEMSVSQKQTLEIVKVLYRGADILILDEPTAVLTPQETEKLFSVIRNMKADGKAVIIITHKLHEVLSISDRVAILRKGEYVGDIATKDANEAKLTEMMVGEKVELNIERPEPVNPVKRLDIEHLTVRSAEGITVLDDASFPVYGGEILGIAGISGNGQKELLEAIAGLQPAESGASIEYYAPDAAAPVQLVGKSPKAIREAGIHLSFVPEDRLGMGLVGSMGMTDNMMLKSYGKGKYLLRKAFEGDWLPPEILWREKAAFSDAVGHSMVDDIKEYAESLYTDEEFQLRRANYSAHCMPFTKESLFYREIFEKYYHDQSRTIVDFWMPNKAWPGCNVNDPSARVLANYGASGV